MGFLRILTCCYVMNHIIIDCFGVILVLMTKRANVIANPTKEDKVSEKLPNYRLNESHLN